MTNEQIRERFMNKISDYMKRSNNETSTKDERMGSSFATWLLKDTFNEVFPELPPIQYDFHTKTYK